MSIATVTEVTKKVANIKLDVCQCELLRSVLDKTFMGVYCNDCDLPYEITAEEAKLMMLLIENMEQITQELHS